MKLEKYLADYIEQELPDDLVPMPHLQEIIKQGLDAFESTEGCKIKLVILGKGEIYRGTD